ncbi:MAG: hypothetical protein IPG45_27070 [Deltaproteobacteria bacterium]|nr:hypothetical protein [Deltaproteobacteria bacterium]
MRRVAAANIVALAAATVGCQDNLQLPYPTWTAWQSLLLVQTEAGVVTKVEAVSAGSPLPSLVLGSSREVHVALYRETLEELSLLEGPMVPAGADGRPVPNPQQVLVLSDPWQEWSAEDRDNSPFATLRLPRSTEGCPPAPTLGTAVVLEGSISDGAIYWADRAGSHSTIGNPVGVWDVAPDGQHREIPEAMTSTLTPTGTSTRPINGAYLSIDGYLYLFQQGGELWKGDFGGAGFERLGPAPGSQSPARAWMTGSREAADVQVAILDDQGGVWTHDFRGWIQVNPPDPRRSIGRGGGLLWLGTDDLLALGIEPGKLTRFKGGQSDFTPPGIEVTAVHLALRTGTLVGDSLGRVWRLEGSFHTVVFELPGSPIRGLGSSGSDLLFGTDEAAVWFVPEARPECSRRLELPAPFVTVVRASGRQVILASSGPAGVPGPIHVIDLVR